MNLDKIFDNLWVDYVTQNPSAGKIHDLFLNEGELVVYDHIAWFYVFGFRANHFTVSINA